jgi:hypothetical protein
VRYRYLSLLLAAFAAAAVAQPGLPGHWEGTIELPAGSNSPNTVALDLGRDPQGAWKASLGVPQQHATGIFIADLRVAGSKVAFNVPDMGASFDLTLAGEKLAGTITVKGQAIAVAMKRTGEAKVEAAPPSPVVSRELEGDWDAAFALPNGQSRPIQVHFRNQPDRTVAATIDSPTQGIHGSLEQIVQNGTTVRFRVRTYGGSFEGTMNAAGTEIAGTWVQGGANPPSALTFRKK